MARRMSVLLVTVAVGTLSGVMYSCGEDDDPSDRAAKGPKTTATVTALSATQLKAAEKYRGYPDGHAVASAGVAGIAFEKSENGTGVRVPVEELGVGAHDDHANSCGNGIARRCNP